VVALRSTFWDAAGSCGGFLLKEPTTLTQGNTITISTVFHQYLTNIMTHPFDTDSGSELFSSYEAELKLVQADLDQKLDQIPDLSGEPRKAAISQAERALEEAAELLDQMRLEKSNIPSAIRTKVNQRFRNHEVSDMEASLVGRIRCLCQELTLIAVRCRCIEA